MLATLKTEKYPYFDKSEIIPDYELTFESYDVIKPLRAGDILPSFTLEKENARWQQFFGGAEVHGPVLFHHLLNKPLVIGFYSGHWQQHGLDLLRQLNTIQHDIKEIGGQLLIISSEKERALEKIVWDNSMSLSFYFDRDREIAAKFRIYSESDPVWNKYSGVDTNVPLLAVFVISPAGQIEYDHVELDFSTALPAKDIISAVQSADTLNNKRGNISNTTIC
jgi:peroxiredoxin